MFTNLWWANALAIFPKSIGDVINAFIVIVVSIQVTHTYRGFPAATQQAASGMLDFITISVVVCMYIAVHVFIISPFKAWKELKSIGFWDGNTYHYNHEKHIYTGIIHPTKQDFIKLEFPKECKDTLVYVRTVIDGAGGRVKAGFSMQRDIDDGIYAINMRNNESKCGIRLNKTAQVLIVQSLPNTFPTKVRVYVESWEL